MTTETTYNVLDLFCGCGGLSLGFEQAGFHVLLGIDIWEDALKTYKHNHTSSRTLCADMSSLTGKEVADIINGEKVDVIIGGPPCQGFRLQENALLTTNATNCTRVLSEWLNISSQKPLSWKMFQTYFQSVMESSKTR